MLGFLWCKENFHRCHGTVFWLIALSKIELSVAYPMLSVGYVLLMILSYFLLNETITVYKVIGTLLVVAGVTLISR